MKAINIRLCAATMVLVAEVCIGGVDSAAIDEAAFREPAVEFSPGYFWMWNAPLTPQALCGQLDDMAANGIRAVCPHPFPRLFRPGSCRSDMEPDYLTPGYLKAYADAVAHAKKLGMHSWLYDEGGWPSGSACRQVAASDEEGRFAVRYLCRDERTGELVMRVEPYGGQWGYVPSVIEPGATERFIELTHEAYAKVCGGEFGKTIRFAFTDEPTRPTARAGKIPWTTDFDAEFRRRKGYDIRPQASLLFAGTNYVDEATAKVRVDYEDVMSQLFVERYLEKLRTWCRAHGLGSGGHLNGEDTPERAVRYGHGSVLRGLRAMDVPGVDTIWRQLFPKMGPAAGRIAPFPRYAASAAHQNGGSVVLSESFCIYADSVTPEQIKWTIDSQLVRGVTAFVFGYYALSNAGQWMILFEPHSGPVQPYWDFEGPLFRYVHRLSALLAQGRPAAEVAVVFDARDFWACGDGCERAAAAHYEVAAALDRRQCDFDFIDDDQIAAADFADGRIRIGRMSYSTVVLPYSKRLLPAARAKLAAFARSGGRVLTADELDRAPRTLGVSGAGAEDIRVLKRTDGRRTVYFLVNESAEPRSVKIDFAERGAKVCRADWQSGEFRPVRAPAEGLAWNFPSCGSVAFVVGGEAEAVAEAPKFGAPRTIVGWEACKVAQYLPGKRDFEIRKFTDSAFAPIALGDWRKVFGEDFSGRVVYRASFEVAKAGRVRLDLGEVKGACAVRLNGREIGKGFFGPHVFEAEAAAGGNILEVEVANTLANALSADAVRDRIAKDFPPLSSYDKNQRPFDREFNESGLYGPVTFSIADYDVSVLDRPSGILGYHLDISNRKVPRMEMMKRIVDIAAKLGYNNFQMNTEHAFAYSKHPEAWRGMSPMTPAEARELDDYCAARGIELVPNQNSFGHFGHWLRLPEYNGLAESPRGGCHSRYRSTPMKNPMSLCPTDPRSIALVAGLYDELFPCFRSKWVNVGLDETYELDDVTGCGRSAAEIKAKGAERVYLEYFKKVYANVKSRGHRMMFWGDIILHKPELIPEIPEDVLCLDWGYGAKFPFDRQAGQFAASGRRFLLCPGTRAWGTVTGNVPEMKSNLDLAVLAGEKHKTAGYLLADWDDGGGVCPWIVSLPSLVYLSLRIKSADVSREQLIARIDEVAGCRCGEALLEYGVIYRDIGGRNDEVMNEYCLALRRAAHYQRSKGVTDQTLAAAKARHAKAKALFDAANAPQWIRDDMALLDLVSTAAETRIENPKLTNFRALFEPEYRRLWLTNSRPGGLEDSLNFNFGL